MFDCFSHNNFHFHSHYHTESQCHSHSRLENVSKVLAILQSIGINWVWTQKYFCKLPKGAVAATSWGLAGRTAGHWCHVAAFSAFCAVCAVWQRLPQMRRAICKLICRTIHLKMRCISRKAAARKNTKHKIHKIRNKTQQGPGQKSRCKTLNSDANSRQIKRVSRGYIP